MNDAEAIYIANTNSVRKYFFEFNNLDDTKKWVKDTLDAVQRGEKTEMMIFSKENEFIGMIAIWKIRPETGEISLWIKHDAQRMGYGKMAIKLLINEYSKPYKKLLYVSDIDNIPSIGLAQSLKFEQVTNSNNPNMIKFVKYL